RYQAAFLDPQAGYVESGRAVATLVNHAKSLGVELRENLKFVRLDESNNRVRGILVGEAAGFSRDANSVPYRIPADAIVMATGAWTPYLLPFTAKFLRSTGHPVFHLKPANPELFSPDRFPFFGGDISMTGFYGFPLNQGVVKVASHGRGREMSP